MEVWGAKIVRDLRDSYRRTKVNASGRLSRTTQPIVTEEDGRVELRIVVNAYGLLLEPGRGPTKKPGPGVLRALIRKWIDDKGIRPKEAGMSKDTLAFLITRKIHKLGTKAYPNRGPKAISSVVNSVEVGKMEKEIADSALGTTIESLIDLRFQR